MTASLMGPNEVAVIVSFSGQVRDAVDVAVAAKNAGARVITSPAV